MTQPTREEIARRIETNPLGWLPGVGDCINITFTPDEASIVTSALRSAATPDARAETNEAVTLINEIKELLVLAYNAKFPKANVNAALHRLTYLDRSIRALAKDTPADGDGETDGKPEFGWLIERGSVTASEPSPKYWAAGMRNPNTFSAWTSNHNQAIRFARRLDAERVAERIMKDIPVRISEHGWPCSVLSVSLSASSARVEVLEAALKRILDITHGVKSSAVCWLRLEDAGNIASAALSKPSTEGKGVQSTTEQTVSGLRSPNQGEG